MRLVKNVISLFIMVINLKGQTLYLLGNFDACSKCTPLILFMDSNDVQYSKIISKNPHTYKYWSKGSVNCFEKFNENTIDSLIFQCFNKVQFNNCLSKKNSKVPLLRVIKLNGSTLIFNLEIYNKEDSEALLLELKAKFLKLGFPSKISDQIDEIRGLSYFIDN